MTALELANSILARPAWGAAPADGRRITREQLGFLRKLIAREGIQVWPQNAGVDEWTAPGGERFVLVEDLAWERHELRRAARRETEMMGRLF